MIARSGGRSFRPRRSRSSARDSVELPARFATSRAATAAAAPTPAAAATARLGPRFVHGDPASIELGFVQLLDGALGRLVGLHLDEGEAARSSCHLIADDIDRVHRADALEQLLKPPLLGVERKVPYKQFATHLHSCPAWALDRFSAWSREGIEDGLGQLATTVQRNSATLTVYAQSSAALQPLKSRLG